MIILRVVIILVSLSVLSHHAQAQDATRFVLVPNLYIAPSRLDNSDWQDLDKNYHFNWKLAAGLREFRRDTDSSQIFASVLKTNLQYRFLEEVTFFGTFSYFFQTGTSQSRYGDLSPNSGVFVDDAYVNVAVIGKETLTVEVGALSQGRTIRNPIFINGSAFPGVSEVLRLGSGNIEVALRAQQLIPFSQTQEVELVETEENPSLQTQSLMLKYQDDQDKLRLVFGLFDYSTLPSTVANASRILGNTVNGQNLNAEFEYDFKGWFGNLEYDTIVFDRVKFEVNAHLLENTEAADRLNRGQEFSGGIGLLGNRAHYFVGGGIFSIEADASPAFYNSSTLGNNNRDGWFGEIILEMRQYEDVRVSLKYVDSEVLNENVFQEDQQYYAIGIETKFRGI